MAGTAFSEQQVQLNLFRLRLWFCGVVVVVALSLLAARFYILQVVQHDHYNTLAENNRMSIVPVVPNRGVILDRSGLVLANNFSAYTLEITPNKIADLSATLDQLATLISITPRDRKRFNKLREESHRLDSLPIKNRLTEEEVARFAANRFRFPGVDINARLFRNYPQGLSASHVIGYIGRINDKDLEALEAEGKLSNYRGSDHLGKIGIEESYEDELHGQTGFEQVEIDAGGRAVRSLSREEPVAGNNLILGLDLKLQQITEKAFGKYRGALVAIDPKSGEILAFVSQPGFDPNLFVDGIDQASWDEYSSSPEKPLNNRAIRGVYPPGSTIKPFMALAGLHYGIRTPTTSIFDPGYYSLSGSSHRYRCWRSGGHGSVALKKSIVISCDTYYYGLAHELGIDRMHDFLGKFGFGQKTGIDVKDEVAGNLPSRAWKNKRFKQVWYPGETVISGIGQGYTLVTPLQLAHATAMIANNGMDIPPHFVKAKQDGRTGEIKPIVYPNRKPANFKLEDLVLVQDAMVAVTQPGGTAARAAAGAEYSFGAKTGTAQVKSMKQGERYDEKTVEERYRDHALFIAYAPAHDPRIALGMIVENGGHGGSTAAPIARQVLDYYLLGKIPAVPIPQSEDSEEHD
ncbi:MAG: penicillin-binding protein 2 [Burkholderiales bacterium]